MNENTLSELPGTNFLLSIVVPVYNESAVLPEFHRRLSEVLEEIDGASEIVYINDGSTDDSLEMLETLKSSDSRVAIVELSRNFGKEAAMTAGIHHTKGEAVVVIDADLQDPPELITKLLEVWQEEKVEVVYARRTSRGGESWLKRASAAGFYRMMRHVKHVDIPVDTGDFRLLDRSAVDALNTLQERHRFMKGLFSWIGFRQVAVPYVRDPRHAGSSKFNYWKLWNFAIEGFTSFTVLPLQFGTYLGAVVACSTLLYAAWVTIKTLAFGDPVQGYPSLMVAVLFIGSVQMIMLGIIGEYLGRVFNETKQRPLYLVRRFSPAVDTHLQQRSLLLNE